MMIIQTRTDLTTAIADLRPDAARFDGLIDAVADQVQHSDHPAWGDDWSAWLHAELPALVEATVDGLAALAAGEDADAPDGGAL